MLPQEKKCRYVEYWDDETVATLQLLSLDLPKIGNQTSLFLFVFKFDRNAVETTLQFLRKIMWKAIVVGLHFSTARKDLSHQEHQVKLLCFWKQKLQKFFRCLSQENKKFSHKFVKELPKKGVDHLTCLLLKNIVFWHTSFESVVLENPWWSS